jgi:hypothetical protein
METKKKTEKQLEAIDKIRKLLEFTSENGATESEIENAMKLAQRLMIKYNLEQGDIEIGFNDINVTKIKSTWEGKWVNLETRAYEWELLQMLSRIYNCQTLRTREITEYELWIKGIKYIDYFKVVGLPEDREMVVKIFQSILPQIRELMLVRYKQSDKSISQFKFNSSYQIGFCEGLEDKLNSDKVQFFTEEEKASWGLIVVKKDTLIENWIQEQIKPRDVKTRQVSLDEEAYQIGLEDGSEKNLNKQIGN